MTGYGPSILDAMGLQHRPTGGPPCLVKDTGFGRRKSLSKDGQQRIAFQQDRPRHFLSKVGQQRMDFRQDPPSRLFSAI